MFDYVMLYIYLTFDHCYYGHINRLRCPAVTAVPQEAADSLLIYDAALRDFAATSERTVVVGLPQRKNVTSWDIIWVNYNELTTSEPWKS